MKTFITNLIIHTCILFASNVILAQDINTQNVSYDDSVDATLRQQIVDVITSHFDQYSTLGHMYTKNDGENFYALFGTGAQLIDDFTYTVLSPTKMHPLDYTDRINDYYTDGIEYAITDVVLNKVGVDDFNYVALLDFKKVVTGYLSDDIISYDNTLTSIQKMKLKIDPYDLNNCTISNIGGRLDATKTDSQEAIVEEVVVEENVERKETDIPTKDEIIVEEDQITTPIIDEADIDLDYSDTEDLSEDKELTDKVVRIYKLKENIFSVGIGGSFGSINTTTQNPDAISVYPFSDTLQSNYRSVPVLDLSYRKSLGKKRKLFLYLNGGIELAKITTDISNFSHNALSQGYRLEGITITNTAQSNIPKDPNNPNNGSDQVRTRIPEEANIFLFPSVKRGSFTDGKESIDLFVLNAMVGMSYKLIKGAASKGSLLIDLGIGTSFFSPAGSNNVSYSGTITGGLKLPNTPLFPRTEIISGLLDKDEVIMGILDSESNNDEPVYISDDKAIDFTGKTSSNLSMVGKMGLTYLYKLNYKYGISASVNYSTTFTSALKSNFEEDSNFLEGSSSNGFNNILEQYHENLGLSRIGIQVGLFFLINNN